MALQPGRVISLRRSAAQHVSIYMYMAKASVGKAKLIYTSKFKWGYRDGVKRKDNTHGAVGE